ncbi:MAG TPA: hypothetical protein VMV27_00820 [Candidatus Binataceae bacterium]|nr:hypothetical protein [Candidatus Binataceae bacterium]
MIRLVYTTACHDISELDFTIRTECAAFIADAQIDSVWVADSTTGHVLARIVDRAQDGDPRNNPRAIAIRIVKAQRDLARELMLRKMQP